MHTFNLKTTYQVSLLDYTNKTRRQSMDENMTRIRYILFLSSIIRTGSIFRWSSRRQAFWLSSYLLFQIVTCLWRRLNHKPMIADIFLSSIVCNLVVCIDELIEKKSIIIPIKSNKLAIVKFRCSFFETCWNFIQ